MSHFVSRNEMALEVGQGGRSCPQVALLWLDGRSRFGTCSYDFPLAEIIPKPYRLSEKSIAISGNILHLAVMCLPERRG